MAVKYQKAVAEDLELGYGSVTDIVNPAGGTMVGTKINVSTFIDSYTDTQRLALTPYPKQLIFNSTTSKLNFYNGSAWVEIADGVL
jgi:hypothetical protein